DALAPLGQVSGPQLITGADALEHLLGHLRSAIRVTGEHSVAIGVGALGAPAAAIEHQVDLEMAVADADVALAAAAGTAAIEQRVGAGRLGGTGGMRGLPRLHLLVQPDCRDHTMTVRMVSPG